MKIGDKATRMLAGTIQLPVYIVLIDDEHIFVSNEPGEYEEQDIKEQNGLFWKFNKDTLAEVDEFLGFDGVTLTCSYLILE